MAEDWKEDFNKAVTLLESGNTLDALEIFSAITLQDENRSQVQYSIAVCHARLGRTSEAINLLEEISNSANPLTGALQLLEQLKTLPPEELPSQTTGTSVSQKPAQQNSTLNTQATSSEKQRFMCVHDFAPDYIPTIQNLCEEAGASTYAQCLEVIKNDGYSAIHMYPYYMPEDIWETQLVFPSHGQLQQQWWQEFGDGSCPANPLELLKRQIEIYQPEVLYFGEPVPPLDSQFLRTLNHKPKIVCGWCDTAIPQQTDWSLFDVILSNTPGVLSIAKQHGAKNALSMHPSFPRWLGEKHTGIAPEDGKDIIFAGQSAPEQFSKRNSYWETVAQAIAEDDSLQATFNLHCPEFSGISTQLKSCIKPQLWGTQKYQEMRRHKIVLNAYSHLPSSEGFNMRLLEGMGLGCFVLNEYVEGIEKHFELDKEIVCFKTTEELVEKIKYYLEHEDERTEIAQRGQAKVFADHALEKNIKVFSDFFVSALKQKEAAQAATSQPESSSNPTNTTGPVNLDEITDVYDKAYLWGWSRPEHKEKVYLCYKTPNHAENAHRFAQSQEFQEEVRILSQLGKPPRKEIKVLDFGCGNGIASYALAKAGYDVTAMDSSTGEIAGINAARKLVGLDGVQFTIHQSKSETIPFPDETFDVVWMREALHHMHDLPEFINGIKRILKPGGILCCLRDPTIFNESQREFLFATHPFYHITHDEGCYYLKEYIDGFRLGGMDLRVLLDPLSSVINTYPSPFVPGRKFDQQAAIANKQTIFLFSFFAAKPLDASASTPSQPAKHQDTNSAHNPAFPGVTFGCGVQITGASGVSMGEGSCIADNCWINTNIRDNQKHLHIGRCVLLGRQSIINASEYVEIGDFTFTSMGALISETYHDYSNIAVPYIFRVGCKGKLVIEENCWLSYGVLIYGNLTVGRGSVIGAGAQIFSDVPPFSVVVGSPQKIVRMFNPQSNKWESIHSDEDMQRVEEARQKCPLPSREQYREMLWKNSPSKKIDPLCAGRGVWI